jgi:hypothetical protein
MERAGIANRQRLSAGAARRHPIRERKRFR